MGLLSTGNLCDLLEGATGSHTPLYRRWRRFSGSLPATPKRMGRRQGSPRRLVRRCSRRRCAVAGLPPADRPRDQCFDAHRPRIHQQSDCSIVEDFRKHRQKPRPRDPGCARSHIADGRACHCPPGRPREPVVTRVAAKASRLIHTLRFRSPHASLRDSPRSPKAAISMRAFADEHCLRPDLGPRVCRLRSPRIDDVRPVRTSSSATPPSSTGSRRR